MSNEAKTGVATATNELRKESPEMITNAHSGATDC